MKKQIKKCKGFEWENPCYYCKRKDENAELLVSYLAIDENTGKKYCNYWLKR